MIKINKEMLHEYRNELGKAIAVEIFTFAARNKEIATPNLTHSGTSYKNKLTKFGSKTSG